MRVPFLTVLAPSKRFCETHERRHKTLTDRTRQIALQVRRWLPKRTIVLVGDSSFAVLDLLAALIWQGMICVTRLRLDAALYEPAPPRQPGAKGRPRKKGARLPTLTQKRDDPNTVWQSLTIPGWYGNTERRVEICPDIAVWYHRGRPVLPVRWILLRDPEGDFEPQALLCTDLNRDPHDIIGWFIRRWSLEVTFRETRDHLGVESQRQWSDQAIARTTPCLLGLFSVVTLLATRLGKRARRAVSDTAWYRKQQPTFSDTLAAVRREIWAAQGFSMSRPHARHAKIAQGAVRRRHPHALQRRMTEAKWPKSKLGHVQLRIINAVLIVHPIGRERSLWAFPPAPARDQPRRHHQYPSWSAWRRQSCRCWHRRRCAVCARTGASGCHASRSAIRPRRTASTRCCPRADGEVHCQHHCRHGLVAPPPSRRAG